MGDPGKNTELELEGKASFIGEKNTRRPSQIQKHTSRSIRQSGEDDECHGEGRGGRKAGLLEGSRTFAIKETPGSRRIPSFC